MTDPADDQGPPPPRPEPTWRPPDHPDGNWSTIVVGVIFLAIGGWYFFDQTLGFEMPRVRWGDLWPVLLIVVGALMLFRSAGRRT